LHWFRSLEALVHNDAEKKKNTEEDAPFTIFVMNEYFDALPVRVLEHIGEGKWKE
jgi:SAM-dependent MidA family methyltransferase